MRDKTPRIIAICALSGALLLGIGIGVAEAHVSRLEREALAAFDAQARPVVLPPGSAVAAKASAATPYIVEVTVTTEDFNAARAAHLRAQGHATL
jgi:hypothetical protein